MWFMAGLILQSSATAEPLHSLQHFCSGCSSAQNAAHHRIVDVTDHVGDFRCGGGQPAIALMVKFSAITVRLIPSIEPIDFRLVPPRREQNCRRLTHDDRNNWNAMARNAAQTLALRLAQPRSCQADVTGAKPACMCYQVLSSQGTILCGLLLG